jgi:outer membrane protein TolC
MEQMHPRTVRRFATKMKKPALTLILLLAAACASAQSSASSPFQTSGGQAAPSQAGQPLVLTQTPSPDSFNGSALIDKPVAGIVSLSILDAINRGLRHNLGLLLSQQQSDAARAQHRRTLSALLPNITGNASDGVNQINLAAFGIPLPPGLTSPVVGPFGLMDLHASLSETFLDFSALNRVRAAAENRKAALYSIQDARELVVLAVGNQYLLGLADAARLETASAQLTTAQAVFTQAQDMKKAGVSAGIDVLRAQVQMQTQQQRVLAARNQFEQQKMALARIIGLPVSQQIALTDKSPYAPLPAMDIDQALARAFQHRPEYLAAESRTHANELQVKAARGEGLPTMQVNGQYGIDGPNPGNSQQIFNLTAGVTIPIFQGGKVKADVDLAESSLRQSKMQLEDLRNRIELEVRSALLDVTTSDEQVGVARQSIDLAAEQLKEAQDRFRAGVSDSLEVVQAQEAVATANETLIQALYLNNVAKLTLVHALGEAEQQTKSFLGGK